MLQCSYRIVGQSYWPSYFQCMEGTNRSAEWIYFPYNLSTCKTFCFREDHYKQHLLNCKWCSWPEKGHDAMQYPHHSCQIHKNWALFKACHTHQIAMLLVYEDCNSSMACALMGTHWNKLLLSLEVYGHGNNRHTPILHSRETGQRGLPWINTDRSWVKPDSAQFVVVL